MTEINSIEQAKNQCRIGERVLRRDGLVEKHSTSVKAAEVEADGSRINTNDSRHWELRPVIQNSESECRSVQDTVCILNYAFCITRYQLTQRSIRHRE